MFHKNAQLQHRHHRPTANEPPLATRTRVLQSMHGDDRINFARQHNSCAYAMHHRIGRTPTTQRRRQHTRTYSLVAMTQLSEQYYRFIDITKTHTQQTRHTILIAICISSYTHIIHKYTTPHRHALSLLLCSALVLCVLWPYSHLRRAKSAHNFMVENPLHTHQHCAGYTLAVFGDRVFFRIVVVVVVLCVVVVGWGTQCRLYEL